MKWDDREKRNELYRRVLEKWGNVDRVCKVAEECSELSAVAVRWVAEPAGHDANQTFDAVLEETADVMVMMEQMELLLAKAQDSQGRTLRDLRDQKLDRLLGFIEEAKDE